MNLITKTLAGWSASVVYPFAQKYVKRDILSKLKTLREFEELSLPERARIQNHRLISMLRHCETKVPYYRDLFQKQKLSAEKIEADFSYFFDIPHLTKEIIRKNSDRLISEDHAQQFLHHRKTNGSTGESLPVKYSQEDIDWSAASNLFIYDFCQRDMHQLEVHFASKPKCAEPSFQEKLYGMVKNISLNRRNIFFTKLEDQEIQGILRQLSKLRPHQVQGHPSTLYALALYVENHLKKPVKYFKKFESTGETLDSHKAAKIQKWLSCQIFNRYGNAEMGVMAHSRETPKELEVLEYLFFAEHHLSTSIDCELVFTSLYNHAMPYLRYLTGDLGEVFDKDRRQNLRRVHGRVHEFVHWRDNSIPTQYFQDILFNRDEVREFQMIVDEQNQLKRVQIVLKADVDLIGKAAVAEYIRDYFGQDLLLEWVELSTLKKAGFTEKFRYITQEL